MLIKAKCDMNRNQELNLCKLLKDHVGITLYSPICGMTRLRNIDENAIYPIKTMDYNYLKDGRSTRASQGRCQLFPSEELYLQYPTDPYAAWTKWADENKKVTYEDVEKQLTAGGHGVIPQMVCTSTKQYKKLIAINKLMNVQKYLEKDWQPDFKNSTDNWYILIDDKTDDIAIETSAWQCADIYFSTESNAQKAIDILGEATIRTALSTDW